jgi:hypothetical protein
VRIKNSSDVSENIKNAQAIAKSWRRAVHELDPDRFHIEALGDPELDQKIDVVDRDTSCAYEFKVSGKNAASELYKDVVKVIIWNKGCKKVVEPRVYYRGKIRPTVPRCSYAEGVYKTLGAPAPAPSGV